MILKQIEASRRTTVSLVFLRPNTSTRMKKLIPEMVGDYVEGGGRSPGVLRKFNDQ
ncbi:unnamed protein product [Hymenolepis diminuta]|uniref:Uncharacterized protein n=1 Tax=Hymenolepis diminuta TaxID=6216 RepID=A0A564Z2X9_HYMDI|nr:unnamed protein product [Hymenolepis diminuta]